KTLELLIVRTYYFYFFYTSGNKFCTNCRKGERMDKLVLGGAIGNCVHVAGVYAYMQLAESVGYKTKFLGAAVPPRELVDAIEKYDPYIVCISYRLTPNALYNILEDFFSMIEEQGLYGDRLFYFGGTPECIAVAKQFEQ